MSCLVLFDLQVQNFSFFTLPKSSQMIPANQSTAGLEPKICSFGTFKIQQLQPPDPQLVPQLVPNSDRNSQCLRMVAAWCQSKHVRLITKCYPPRTANPPKPNSSELSYLTYYAYTTPSKLKKVGKYLQHRAEKGLTKGRTGYCPPSLRFLGGRD